MDSQPKISLPGHSSSGTCHRVTYHSRAKGLPLGTWIVLDYPAASSCLAIKTYLSVRAQLKASFSLIHFLLSPAGKSSLSSPSVLLEGLCALLSLSSMAGVSWNARVPFCLYFSGLRGISRNMEKRGLGQRLCSCFLPPPVDVCRPWPGHQQRW